MPVLFTNFCVKLENRLKNDKDFLLQTAEIFTLRMF